MVEGLRAALESELEAEEIRSLGVRYLGLDPSALSAATAARAADDLVRVCTEREALEALADVLVTVRPGLTQRLAELRRCGAIAKEPLGPGASLGPFTLESKLGESPDATVFRAREDDQRTVRLRLLRLGHGRAVRAAERYLAAARLVGSVEGRFLPTGVLAGTARGRRFVAHDFHDGVPVELGVPRPLPEAWPLLRRVLTALTALHARGMAHGAVHENNLLFGAGDPPDLRLVDAGAYHFRAAGLAGGLHSGKVSAVALAWAAPEQVLGELPTPRSDVYAVGLLMHALLTGRLPLAPDTPRLAFEKLTRSNALAPSLGDLAVSPGAEEVLLRLLDPDPLRRPPSAQAALELLVSVVDARPSLPSTPASDADVDPLLERLLADPSDEEAAAALEAASTAGSDPRRIADAFALAADQVDGADEKSVARRLWIRAGSLYESAAGDPRAAERAYRRALDFDARDNGASAALERVLRRLGEYEKLVELLLDRRDVVESRADRANLLSRLGQVLHQHLGNDAQALLAFAAAVAEDPESDAHAAALETATQGDRDAWQSALDAMTDAVNAEDDVGRRRQLAMRMGEWYEERLRRPDLALSCFRSVLERDPNHEPAHERMADIYRRAQLWSDLTQALLSHAAVAALPSRARDLRVEAARTMLEHGGTEVTAVRLLEQVLEDDPGHDAAANLLARAHRRAGRHREWIAVMERRAENAIGEARQQLLTELARGHVELGDADAAIACWEQVLAEDPTDLDALHALEEAYRASGRHGLCVELLEREVGVAVTPARQVALLERIANIQETDLLDEEAAATTWERVLALDPDHDGALRSLTESHRRRRRWDALATVLERRAEVTSDAMDRVSLLLELARVVENELGDRTRALAAYETALPLDPTNRVALDATARLRAEVGDIEQAASALDALAEQSESPDRRAEHLLAAAALFAGQGHAGAAEDRYRAALEAKPGHADAARRLAQALVTRGEAGAAITLLERAAGHAKGRDEAEIGAVLARVLLEERHEIGRARGAASIALERDPGNARVHAVLGDIALSSGDAEEALRQYEAALPRLDRFDDQEALKLLAARVEATHRSGDTDTARRLLAELVDRGGSDRATAVAAARLAFDVEEPEQALQRIAALLRDHESTLPLPELAAARHRRGVLLRRLGNEDAAIACFERAAATDRKATEPLLALVEMYRAAGHLDELRDVVERLTEIARASGERDLLVQMGDVAAEVLRDVDAATTAYFAALADGPDDRRVLLRLLKLHSDGHDWNRLLDVLLRLAKLAPARRDRAHYLHTAARIMAGEMGMLKEALELHDQALRDDPTSEAILFDCIALRSKLGDTAGVRRMLEAQIARASARKDRESAYRFATRLADVHLGELDVDDAVAINEAALALVSGDPEREAMLFDLYMTDPKKYLARGAKLQRAAIARDAFDPEPYRKLFALSLGAERRDAAWCACQALVALEQDSAEQEAFFRNHAGSVPIEAMTRVSDSDFNRLITHPDVNPLVTSLLMQIRPVIVGALNRYSFESLGLHELDALGPWSATGTMANLLQRASELYRVPLPILFERADAKQALTIGKGARQHVLLSTAAARESLPVAPSAFMAGSCIAVLRPGHDLRVLLSPTELKAWVLAAIRLVAPKLAVGDDVAPMVDAARASLERHLGEQLQSRIRRLVETLLEEGGQFDLKRWVRGVDATTDRAGLLFCNRLPVALAAIRAAGDAASSLTVKEREQALLTYSVSSEFLTLRNRLSVSSDIEVPEEEAELIAPFDDG